MFSLHCRKKPLITSLKLTSSLVVQCTQEELFKLTIPHAAIRRSNDSSFNCTFDNSPYQCQSRQGLEQCFIDMWKDMLKIYDIYPDRVSTMSHRITLSGIADNAKVNQSFTDLDAFHEFLAQFQLVSPHLLRSQLNLGYSFRVIYEPTGSVDGGSITPLLLDSYEATLNDLQRDIATHTSVANLYGNSKIASEQIKLYLKGRIGTQYVTHSFDSIASLKEYLHQELHDNTNSQSAQNSF